MEQHAIYFHHLLIGTLCVAAIAATGQEEPPTIYEAMVVILLWPLMLLALVGLGLGYLILRLWYIVKGFI